jgi:outer membrane biogenesis lipoprotein LolB
MITRLRIPSVSAILAAVLLLGAALAVTGCASRSGRLPEQADPEAAWQTFRHNSCAPPAQPAALIKGSLYYSRITPTRRTNRTLFSMWGDFDGPMRLDVSAGIGKLLAHIREDRAGLLVYYPEQKTAYAHTDPVLGATRLGMPFPFSLNQLARVTVGDFAELAPPRFDEGARENGGFAFAVNHRLAAHNGNGHGTTVVTSISLDKAGRPVLMRGTVAQSPAQRGTGDGTKAALRTWRLEINTYEEDGAQPPMPGRLTLSMDDGEKGVLRITAREFKVASWPARATGLELPDDTRLHRLDRASRSQDTAMPVVYEDK